MHKPFLLAAVAVVSVALAAGAAPVLPNPRLTPGATLPVTKAQVCVRGYAGRARHVTEATKRAVFREYGIKDPAPHDWEIDHLVSLELGGSNAIQNLWPQSYITKPYNAHVKDRLEDRLHALVCHGKVSLQVAQQAIRGNWIATYRKYVGALP